MTDIEQVIERAKEDAIRRSHFQSRKQPSNLLQLKAIDAFVEAIALRALLAERERMRAATACGDGLVEDLQSRIALERQYRGQPQFFSGYINVPLDTAEKIAAALTAAQERIETLERTMLAAGTEAIKALDASKEREREMQEGLTIANTTVAGLAIKLADARSLLEKVRNIHIDLRTQDGMAHFRSIDDAEAFADFLAELARAKGE